MSEREPAGREPSGREPSGREPSGREPSGREPSDEALQRRLERLGAALGGPPPGAPVPASRPALPAEQRLRTAGRAGAPLGLAMIALGIALGQWGLVAVGALVTVLAGALLIGGVGEAVLGSLPAGLVERDPSRPHVGMGATVAHDAVIEPGATVEMGATVGAGAQVRRGAVVRMGSTVMAGAVLEERAVLGWGATLMSGAVLGEGATVGAGATVSPRARVPAGTRIMPGSSWAARASAVAPGTAAAVHRPSAPARDPRLERIDAACEKIASELESAPPQVRAQLGPSVQNVASLRKTCHGLVERERLLRAESRPEALAFLAQEKAELERKIAATADDGVRSSLRSAVEAIDDQHRQRKLLGGHADRLDAELTRLQWTLEGMGAQLVRLRSAGLELTQAPDPSVVAAMAQLHDEVDAIADALEAVAREDQQARSPMLEPIAEVAGGADRTRPPQRERT